MPVKFAAFGEVETKAVIVSISKIYTVIYLAHGLALSVVGNYKNNNC